jgi:hypothetical protein
MYFTKSHIINTIVKKNFWKKIVLLIKMSMKNLKGILLKMDSTPVSTVSDAIFSVDYSLTLGQEVIQMNSLLGHELELLFEHEIHCIHCGRLTKTSFAQGYCYPCFISLPQTDACVLHPEMCRAHEGISRDMEWSREHCLKDHIVYLAVSSGLKVGVTRVSQVPARWIDQGAWKAICLARTPNRFLAGTIEVALKDYYQDKTQWKDMLKNDIEHSVDLVKEKGKAGDLLPFDLQQYLSDDDRIVELTYPVLEYPVRVNAINLDKTDHHKGVLTGIKGQYLIFDKGDVINIRRHSGYLITMKMS